MSSTSTAIFCHNLLTEEWSVIDIQKVFWEMLTQPMAFPLQPWGETPKAATAPPTEPNSNPTTEIVPATPVTPVKAAKEPAKQKQKDNDLIVMIPESIVSIRPIQISAKATRKRLQANTSEIDDSFEPRPSRLAKRAFDRCLTSDDDIWVERFYYNRARQRVYFYRSFKTGKCVLSEPPSGAHCIVYMNDLSRAPKHIQQFALERLDKEVYLNCMEKSRPTLPPPTILRAKLPIKKPLPKHAKRRHATPQKLLAIAAAGDS